MMKMNKAVSLSAALLALVFGVTCGVVNALDVNGSTNNNLRGASTEPVEALTAVNKKEPLVVLLPPLEEGEQSKNHQSKRHRSLQTSRTVLILRVRSPSLGEPSVSANDLYYAVFSSDNSLKHQLARCSAGLVQLNPTAYGVVEVQVDNANSNTAVDDFITMTTTVAPSYVGGGYSNIRDVADHVIIVLPKVNNFVAKAEITNMGQQHAIASFNDANGASLSVLEHEIAHNLGMYHAWFNNVEYGDVSGNMGMSLAQEGGPQSCYNAANHWKLNWYSDSRLDLTNIPGSPVTVEVPAFVDYQTVRSNPSKSVLVKVGSSLYLQYNMAKSFNSGTRQYPNMLAVVRDSSTRTDLLGGLDSSNPSWTDGSVYVQLCATQSTGSYDFMLISVGAGGTDCNAPRASSSGQQQSSSNNNGQTSSSASSTGGTVVSSWTSSWFHS